MCPDWLKELEKIVNIQQFALFGWKIIAGIIAVHFDVINGALFSWKDDKKM